MIALSLGAGVQSSCLLLMACAGALPKPDHVIFADTQWEPEGVYKQLDYLRGQAEAAGIPVHIVSTGDIRKAFTRTAVRRANPPLFVLSQDGDVAMLRRQCTMDYKIEPVRRKLRELVGKRGKAELWLGITVDEIQRAKSSQVKWVTHKFPLLDRRMRRSDCLTWMAEAGHPPCPKSACIGCPFRSNESWASLKRTEPKAWSEAVELDSRMRSGGTWKDAIRGQPFLHRSGLPLGEAPVDSDITGQLDLWPNECEGMCGL